MLMELKGISLTSVTLGGRKIEPLLSFYHFPLAGLKVLQFLSWLLALSDDNPESQNREDFEYPHHLSAAILSLCIVQLRDRLRMLRLQHSSKYLDFQDCPCKTLTFHPWNMSWSNFTALLNHLFWWCAMTTTIHAGSAEMYLRSLTVLPVQSFK